MNDALRKKSSELKQLTGIVATFGKKTESVLSRKRRRVGGFLIAFLAVVIAGSMFHFFFFRTVEAPMEPMAAPVSTPEPVAAGNQPEHATGVVSPEGVPGTAPDVENKASETDIKVPVFQQRILQSTTAVEPKNKEGQAVSVAEEAPERKKARAVVAPAERFYQKAVSYHRQNRLPEAISLYLAVLKENPGHKAAGFNLAAAYIQTAAYPEAFTLLESLSARDPGNPEIVLNMAISKIGSGELQEALMLLNAAEEKHAPAFELCFHRGVIFSRSGQPEEALRWYQKAEGINPHEDRLIFNMALIHDKLRQYEAALRYYLLLPDQGESSLTGEKESVADRVRVLRSYLGRSWVDASGVTE